MRLVKRSKQVHRSLLWVVMSVLFLFVISALTHPLMVWTGPQPILFKPPFMTLTGEDVQVLPSIIKNADIQEAAVVKVISTKHGNALQFTTSEKSPRQYYSLQAGKWLKEYDVVQAEWLARYYTGEQSDIKNTEFITDFSSEYSRVNRLLPVYKVSFDTQDNRSVYVYTETNSLAAMNNDWKRILQGIFQAFHTWSWLDDFPIVRIGIVTVMLFGLSLSMFTGSVMLFKMKRRRYQSVKQKVHRYLAWLVLLPLASFTLSGIYHLYQSEFGENVSGMRLGSSLNVANIEVMPHNELAALVGKPLNSFSLVEYEGHLFFRVGFAQAQHPNHFSSDSAHADHASVEKRNRRFDGISHENDHIYISLQSPSYPLSDEIYSKYLATQYLGVPHSSVRVINQVTRFSPEYDFRNKRLPVWKVATSTNKGHILFVDPITGILVDQSIHSQRYERYSFSFLHKWNFMTAFVKRHTRDVVMVIFLGLVSLLAIFGFLLRKRH